MIWASWIQIPIHLSEGRIRIRLWIRLRILPFSHKCVDIMFAKLDFTTKVEKKIKFLRLKMMCLWASYKKKIWKQQNVFCILKINEERSRIRSCFWIWIHWSEIRIRGPGSAQNCHRSPTLLTNFFPVQIHKYYVSYESISFILSTVNKINKMLKTHDRTSLFLCLQWKILPPCCPWE